MMKLFEGRKPFASASLARSASLIVLAVALAGPAMHVSFGPFQLLDLEDGKAESIKRRVLADQLGPELTKQFGLETVDVVEKVAPGKAGAAAKKAAPAGVRKPGR